MKITNLTLAIAAVTLVAVLALIAALIWAGRAPDQLVYLIVALVGPAVPGFVNYAKTQSLSKQVQDVQGKVNGRMTELIAQATANGYEPDPELLAALGITPPEPATP